MRGGGRRRRKTGAAAGATLMAGGSVERRERRAGGYRRRGWGARLGGGGHDVGGVGAERVGRRDGRAGLQLSDCEGAAGLIARGSVLDCRCGRVLAPCSIRGGPTARKTGWSIGRQGDPPSLLQLQLPSLSLPTSSSPFLNSSNHGQSSEPPVEPSTIPLPPSISPPSRPCLPAPDHTLTSPPLAPLAACLTAVARPATSPVASAQKSKPAYRLDATPPSPTTRSPARPLLAPAPRPALPALAVVQEHPRQGPPRCQAPPGQSRLPRGFPEAGSSPGARARACCLPSRRRRATPFSRPVS